MLKLTNHNAAMPYSHMHLNPNRLDDSSQKVPFFFLTPMLCLCATMAYAPLRRSQSSQHTTVECQKFDSFAFKFCCANEHSLEVQYNYVSCKQQHESKDDAQRDATARKLALSASKHAHAHLLYTPRVSVLSNSLPAIVGYLVPEFSCATNMLIYFFRLAESFQQC